MILLEDVEEARARLADHAVLTPCLPARVYSERIGAEVYFKVETLQRTGSFKLRGALNRMTYLNAEERRHGVLAASAGNHAQGVAASAALLGIAATIVMPETTPQIKITNTEAYSSDDAPVTVVKRGASYDDAYDHALELQAERGATLIHPFDDERVIAGQATLGLELIDQVDGLEAVVVPVGGGGLIAGVAAAIHAVHPQVEIYGAQCAAAPAMKLSLDAGRRKSKKTERTLADGICVRRPGEKTFAYVKRHVEAIELVSEPSLESALVDFLENGKTLIEGAAATAVAAATGPLRSRLQGKRVAIVLSGGNIDLDVLNTVIDRALARSHRLIRLRATLEDKPGALKDFLGVIADAEGNIQRIIHDRIFARASFHQAQVVVTLGVRHREHGESILQALLDQGYAVEEIAAETGPVGA